MQHHAATDFWNEYLALPREIRARLDLRLGTFHPARLSPASGKNLGFRP